MAASSPIRDVRTYLSERPVWVQVTTMPRTPECPLFEDPQPEPACPLSAQLRSFRREGFDDGSWRDPDLSERELVTVAAENSIPISFGLFGGLAFGEGSASALRHAGTGALGVVGRTRKSGVFFDVSDGSYPKTIVSTAFSVAVSVVEDVPQAAQ